MLNPKGETIRLICALLLGVLLGAPAAAEPIKCQVTGLFLPEREQDLRDVVASIPGVKVVAVDFRSAEVVFDYDPRQLALNGKPEQVLQKLDNLLTSASRHTFAIKPLRKTPLQNLKLIEIPVAGLDCKACCLVAYEAIYKLDGVEYATVSFREGRATARIDPAKTDRATLEAALMKKGVRVVAQ